MDPTINALKKERKVNKLLQAWQVPALLHVGTTIQASPTLRTNFENSVAFLAGELEQMKAKHSSRNISQLGTEDSNDGVKRELKQLKRQLKETRDQLKAKRLRGGDGGKKKGKKKGSKKPSNKFDKNDPGAYLTAKAWNKLQPEEQEAARKAREQEGIGSKSTISSITTADPIATEEKDTIVVDDTDEEEEETERERTRRVKIAATSTISRLDVIEQPTRDVRAPPHLLVAPTMRQIATTQQGATYAKKPKGILKQSKYKKNGKEKGTGKPKDDADYGSD